MNLVEALEKTLSLALNSTSTTNQSIFLIKKNIGKIIDRHYLTKIAFVICERLYQKLLFLPMSMFVTCVIICLSLALLTVS